MPGSPRASHSMRPAARGAPMVIPQISYWEWPGEVIRHVADPPAVYSSFMSDADVGSIMGGGCKAGKNILDWLGVCIPTTGWLLSSTLCRPQRVVLILSRNDSSRLMFVVIRLSQG